MPPRRPNPRTVAPSIIARYLVRADRCTVSTRLLYGVVPLIGFALTAWLWTSLAPLTVLLGAAWIAVGLFRLLWHTRLFTRPVPSMHISG